MKKILSLLLVLTILLSACGQTEVDKAQNKLNKFTSNLSKNNTEVKLEITDNEKKLEYIYTVGSEKQSLDITTEQFELYYKIDEIGKVVDTKYIYDGEDRTSLISNDSADEIKNIFPINSQFIYQDKGVNLDKLNSNISKLDPNSDNITNEEDYYIYKDEDITYKINKNKKELIIINGDESITLSII